MPASNPTIRLALVEGHAETRERWACTIEKTPRLKCTCSCKDGEEALRRLPDDSVDVVLIGFQLPRVGGIECTRRLKSIAARLQILMLTRPADSDSIFEALTAGADGFVLTPCSPEELDAAVSEVYQGGVPMPGNIARRVIGSFRRSQAKNSKVIRLSPREVDVLSLHANGLVSKEVALRLGLSYETVRGYLKNIYYKLGVRSCGEAVARFNEMRPPARILQRTSPVG